MVPPPATPPRPAEHPLKKTLVIEDDRPTRMLLGRILKSRGHHVQACETAEAALEVIDGDFFPLITLDIQLPGMSGLEFARKLRSRPDGDSYYILVGTGNSRPEDLREILEAGADDYIAKPYHPGLLDVRLSVAEASLVEIARRKALEAELLFLARHDPLTKLMNRNCLGPAIEAAIRSAKSGSPGSLLYLDIDNFKIVNDSLGHETGDDLLLKVAEILRRHGGQSDSLIRFGGDEFVIVMPGTPVDEAVGKAEGMREALLEIVYVARDKPLRVGSSIGVAPIGPDVTASDVMGAADEACYAAKAKGRSRVEIHTAETGAIARLILDTDWSARISEAMRDGSLQLWFQPIIDLTTSTCFAQELLLRYSDLTTGETINPAAFLDPIRRSGQMTRLDRFVIARAFQDLAAHPHLRVSINVSGELFSDVEYCDFVESMLRDSGIDPSRVLFEITENELIASLPVASEAIRRLQTAGCRFGLDDFGAGFSSLSYLKNLPIDFIKIDGSFTSDLATQPFQQALVKAVQDIAAALGVHAVAEFVETPGELLLVKQIGIRLVQGHLLGRPRREPFTPREISAHLAALRQV
jgi:diguanylate cyclase (GGDEF)-like protein